MRFLIGVLGALLLCSCAGAPVGWGGTHKVLFRDSDTITIQYDQMLETSADVAEVARAHCWQFKKRATVANIFEDSSSMGLVKTYMFSCVAD